MKKLLLTSLAGILAVSTANAFEIAPYASIKGGYSVTDIAVKGDSLHFDAAIESAVEPIDIRVHTNNVWSFNPAVGAKMHFDNLSLLSFRVEAEMAWNQEASQQISIAPEVIAPVGARAEAGVKTWSLMANAYVDFETGTFVKPFISAGLGYGSNKLNVAANMVEEDGYYNGVLLPSWKERSFVWSVGAGLTFDLDENISIDAQYRYLDQGAITVDVLEDVSIDVKDVMHQFMLGVRYTF